MLGDIIRNKKINKPTIYVCKPDRTKIGILKNIKELELTLKFGSINEITFKIPYKIQKNHQTIRNPLVDLVKYKYLLWVKEDNEYYEIQLPKRSASDGKEYLNIQAFSQAYELRDKLIMSYKNTKTASEALTDALAETDWSIGFINSTFNNKTRTFDISESTVLDFIVKIEESFGGILIYSTHNKTVSLYREDELENNKRFKIKYGKYLKSINEEFDQDSLVTAIRPIGKDGLGIQSVTPNGSPLLIDFSYFMNTDYMSQGLIDAIEMYNKKLEDIGVIFPSLLNTLNIIELELLQLQTDLFWLDNGDKSIPVEEIDGKLKFANDTDEAKYLGLYAIEDTIDILNAVPNRTEQQNIELSHYLILKNIIDGLIDVLINDENKGIKAKEKEIDEQNKSINNVRNSLALEKFFTAEQLVERQRFIIIRNWQDSNYTHAKDLLEEATKKLAKMIQPQIEYKIDIVDLLQNIDSQHDWDKIKLGDTIAIEYDSMNIKVSAKIMEIKHNWESKSLSLTISNIKNSNILATILKNSASTSSTIDLKKSKFGEVDDLHTFFNNLIDDKLKDTVDNFKMSFNESVEAGRRGILIKSKDNPDDTYLIMNHQAIGLVKNSQFRLALTADGVVAESLYGKQVVGVDGKFEGLEIYDGEGNLIIKLGKYFENDIEKGYIEKRGISITRADKKARTLLNDAEIKIQKHISGDKWEDRLYADANGDLVVEKLKTNKLVMKNGNDVLIDAETKKIDFSKFDTVLGQVKAENVDARNLRVDAANVEGTLVAQKLNVKEGETLLLDGYKDTNGGKLAIYNNLGDINAKIGSEGVGGSNSGGILLLYNIRPGNQGKPDSAYKRVEIGTSADTDSGTMQLRDGHGNARVGCYADSDLGSFITLYDSNGVTKTLLTSEYGVINGYDILTKETPIIAKFA